PIRKAARRQNTCVHQRLNFFAAFAVSCGKKVWSSAFTQPEPAEAGTPKESVSIGIHPWLNFFAFPLLRVDKNQRSSASIGSLKSLWKLNVFGGSPDTT